MASLGASSWRSSAGRASLRSVLAARLVASDVLWQAQSCRPPRRRARLTLAATMASRKRKLVAVKPEPLDEAEYRDLRARYLEPIVLEHEETAMGISLRTRTRPPRLVAWAADSKACKRLLRQIKEWEKAKEHEKICQQLRQLRDWEKKPPALGGVVPRFLRSGEGSSSDVHEVIDVREREPAVIDVDAFVGTLLAADDTAVVKTEEQVEIVQMREHKGPEFWDRCPEYLVKGTTGETKWVLQADIPATMHAALGRFLVQSHMTGTWKLFAQKVWQLATPTNFYVPSEAHASDLYERLTLNMNADGTGTIAGRRNFVTDCLNGNFQINARQKVKGMELEDGLSTVRLHWTRSTKLDSESLFADDLHDAHTKGRGLQVFSIRGGSGIKIGAMHWPADGLYIEVTFAGMAGSHYETGACLYLCRESDISACVAAFFRCHPSKSFRNFDGQDFRDFHCFERLRGFTDERDDHYYGPEPETEDDPNGKLKRFLANLPGGGRQNALTERDRLIERLPEDPDGYYGGEESDDEQ